ncbi:NAD(+)--rifampin ADP-ribosyltransferase [Parapedobacter sp.]
MENDPNVTDKKFPGNLILSYRTRAPMKIAGEVTEWVRQTPEAIPQFQEKLAANKGEID